MTTLKRKHFDIEGLKILRQKYITDFVIAGGRPSRAHFTSPGETYPYVVPKAPRQLHSPLFALGSRHKHSSRSNGASESSALAAASLCCQRMCRTSVKFSTGSQGGVGQGGSREQISAMRFDRNCVLLAVASSSGLLRVYDFVECMDRLHSG